MSLLSRLGYRPPRDVRQLTALQSAELATEDVLNDARREQVEALQEAAECTHEAKLRRVDADVALASRHRDYPLTTLTTALGVAACTAGLANWTLETLMFTSMGITLPVAALAATVSTAAYSGLGALAVHRLGGEPVDKLLGALLLALLLVIGILLVPQLAHARAGEMLDADIRAAQSRITIVGTLSDGSPQDQMAVADAQAALPALLDEQATAERVFVIVLGITLLTEVVLAGYAFDLPVRLRARRLQRVARRLDQEAEDATNHANVQNDAVYDALTDIARDHALELPTVHALLDARAAARLRRAEQAEAEPAIAAEPVIDIREPVPGTRAAAGTAADIDQVAPLSAANDGASDDGLLA